MKAKITLLFGGILLLIVVANFLVWKSFDRYSLAHGGDGYVYQLDKRTGHSWLLVAGQKVPVREIVAQQEHELRELNILEQMSVTGSASAAFSSGGVCTWNFAIHNGLDSAIEELVIAFTLKDSSSSNLWTRDYRVRETIEPLASKTISLQIPGSSLDSKFEWIIKKGLKREVSTSSPATRK